MASRYAERTNVPSDRSRAEIETTLRRFGATAFAYGWDEGTATIGFQVHARRIRMNLPLPGPRERRFTHTPGRNLLRDEASREAEYERAVCQSWRALLLIIKAKLEAVTAGVTTVESEFLANTLLPNGATVGDWALPQVAAAYERNEMPALLPGTNGVTRREPS